MTTTPHQLTHTSTIYTAPQYLTAALCSLQLELLSTSYIVIYNDENDLLQASCLLT